MTILAIDTSCDETSAAVVADTKLHSSVVWSQSKLHASFGGVMPSLAKRKHEERIGAVVAKALGKRYRNLENIDAVAVTVGPGLSIALGVGIDMAKKLAKNNNLPLIPINHIEAHLFSALARPIAGKKVILEYPALGLVASGGTTSLFYIEKTGKVKLLAKTTDDAVGEALDKSARLLGLGYPGGPVLEKFAKLGDPGKYSLPIPLKDDVEKNRFSYSGIKTAFVRLYKQIDSPTKQDVCDLAASFQNTALTHIENVLKYQVIRNKDIVSVIAGGGVVKNAELRKRIRRIAKKHNLRLYFPYTNKLYTDNAAMVGVLACLKYKNINLKRFKDYESVDRNPRLAL